MVQDRLQGQKIKNAIQNQISVLNEKADSLGMTPQALATAMLKREKIPMLAYLNANGLTPVSENTNALATQITMHIAGETNKLKNSQYADNGRSDYMGDGNGPYTDTNAFDEYAGGRHRHYSHYNYNHSNFGDDMGLLGLDQTLGAYNDGTGNDIIIPDSSVDTNTDTGIDTTSDTGTAFPGIGDILGPLITVGGNILNTTLQQQNLQQQGKNLFQQRINNQQQNSAKQAQSKSMMIIVFVILFFFLLLVLLTHKADK